VSLREIGNRASTNRLSVACSCEGHGINGEGMDTCVKRCVDSGPERAGR
jgi:hypothetical protein